VIFLASLILMSGSQALTRFYRVPVLANRHPRSPLAIRKAGLAVSFAGKSIAPI